MPINYRNYHPDWKDIIRPRILKRDNYRCRECSVPNHTRVVRESNGSWLIVDDIIERETKKTGQKIINIVLTVAHLNHIVTDNRDENLKTLCQLHHIQMDIPHKKAMQQVATLWEPSKAIKLASEPGGEIYTPHLMVLARARRNQLSQLLLIKRRRAKYRSYSQYDKDLSILIDTTKVEYRILTRTICDILSIAYNHPSPERFINEYWSSDSKIIGLQKDPVPTLE